MPIPVSFSAPNLSMSFSASEAISEKIRQQGQQKRPQDGDAVLGSEIRKKYDIKDDWYRERAIGVELKISAVDKVSPLLAKVSFLEPRCYDAVLGSKAKSNYQRGKDSWYFKRERSLFDFSGYEPVDATIVAEERAFPSREYGIKGESAGCLVVRGGAPEYFLIVTLKRVDLEDFIAFERELRKNINNLTNDGLPHFFDVRVKNKTFCNARLIEVESNRWIKSYSGNSFNEEVKLTFQYSSVSY